MTTAPAPVEIVDGPVDAGRPGGRLTVILILGFIATAQWSGLIAGPAQLSDLLLFAVLLLILLAPRVRQVPSNASGVVTLLGLTALASGLALVVPPDASYLMTRVTQGASGAATTMGAGVGTSALGPFQFLFKISLGIGGGWLLMRRLMALRPERGAVLFMRAWLVGAVFSSAAAVLESAAGLDLSGFLAQPLSGTRVSGLAFYPNTLATYAVTAIPLTAHLFLKRKTILPGLAALVVLWAGLIASDSRIGIGVAIICTAAIPLFIGRAGTVIAFITTVGLMVLPFVAAGVLWVIANTRLGGGGGAAESDQGRSIVMHQNIADFQHSPIFGVGFGGGGGGLSAPLIILGCGGVLTLAGFVVFLGWCTRLAWPHMGDLTVRTLLFSGFALVVDICWQNNLTDRAEYLFFVLVAVLGIQKTWPAHTETAQLLGVRRG